MLKRPLRPLGSPTTRSQLGFFYHSQRCSIFCSDLTPTAPSAATLCWIRYFDMQSPLPDLLHFAWSPRARVRSQVLRCFSRMVAKGV